MSYFTLKRRNGRGTVRATRLKRKERREATPFRDKSIYYWRFSAGRGLRRRRWLAGLLLLDLFHLVQIIVRLLLQLFALVRAVHHVGLPAQQQAQVGHGVVVVRTNL